jgi:DNA repair protein RadA
MSAKNLLVTSGLLDKDTKTADDVLKDERNKIRLTTGSKELDSLLIGGLETGAITEFYGQFGSGKSQICHTCAVLATTPLENGGLDGNVLWLDTEGTMRAERLNQIAVEREIDPVMALGKIVQMEVIASGQLELIVRDMAKYIKKYNPRLIIIDSIIALHRAEFVGRGTLADRQQSLNSILHKLRRVAKVKKLAIIITNQVSSSPDTFFGNPEKATGGNILGHGATYRVGLRKIKNGRVATMIDSPGHPYSSVEFCLNEKGIDDIDKEKLSRKLKEKLEEEEKEEVEESTATE